MNTLPSRSQRLAAAVKNIQKKIAQEEAFSKTEQAAINRALRFGQKWHANQFRDTGDFYFIHPIRVATKCLDFGNDAVLICAALLHDTLEDTSTDYEQIVNEFGEDVARLVKALTKFKQEARSISAKRIFQLAQKDLRVLLIKIIDRLDNLEDLHLLSRKRQRENANESIVYATATEGIGLQDLADEFRNRAFSILYPLRYKRVVREIEKISKLNQPLYSKIETLLWSTVGTENCHDIHYQLKKPYDFLVPDHRIINILKRFTLLVDNILDCYHILGVLHTNMRVAPLRFRDYITNPLANGWTGLETTLICYGLTVQVWITTTNFHLNNKLGIFNLIKQKIYHSTAHQDFIQRFAGLFSEKYLSLDEIFRTGYQQTGALKGRLSAESHFQVSTPRGDILQMLSGATVLDFAFGVHSEIGIHCLGAIINESYRVDPAYQLQEGNIVEILTDEKNVFPDKSWLKQVVMPHSRKEILAYLKKAEKISLVEKGGK